MIKSTIRIVLVAAVMFTMFSSSAFAAQNKPRVRIQTSHGDIVVELDMVKAPKSAKNFLTYVKDGYYENTIFHRVIDGFMVQGGGFTAEFERKPTRDPVENEAMNGLKNERGTIAMARTSAPHSATSQFFINVANNEFLNYRAPTMRGWGYTVFGLVVEGMDTVDKIRKIPTGRGGPFPKDVPQDQVIILKASIDDGSSPAAPSSP